MGVVCSSRGVTRDDKDEKADGLWLGSQPPNVDQGQMALLPAGPSAYGDVEDERGVPSMGFPPAAAGAESRLRWDAGRVVIRPPSRRVP